MNTDPAPKRPTPRRPFSWAGRIDAVPLVLLAFALPAFIAFSWHDGLATVSDDSVSYLVQARVYAGTASPAVREWLGNAAHFPPLFPLLLAWTGGADDFLRGHLLVALAAAFSLVPIHAFAARRAGRGAGAALVVLFLLTPTAWVSELGILSEPLFLLLTFATLAFHARLAEHSRPATGSRLVVGILLAACVLTRTAGVALVCAYCAWAVVRIVRREERLSGAILPLVPVAAGMALWLLLRAPLQGENYALVMRNAWRLLANDPLYFASNSLAYLGSAWIGSFTAESHVYGGARWLLLGSALLALGGAARAALANRMDGWYALAYTAMLAFWLFPEETTRRLLYPLVPLALFHAGELVHAAGQRLLAARARWLVAGGMLVVAALSLPALALLASKATDRGPVLAGSTLEYAGITEYYTTIPLKPAHEIAGRQLAVLSGLANIERATPPDAAVMWMRPDYIAILSHRKGVPSYYREGIPGTVRRLVESRAGFVVVSTLYKADILGEARDPVVTLAAVAPFTRVVFVVRNPAAPIDEFALLEVDRAALERYAAALADGSVH